MDPIHQRTPEGTLHEEVLTNVFSTGVPTTPSIRLHPLHTSCIPGASFAPPSLRPRHPVVQRLPTIQRLPQHLPAVQRLPLTVLMPSPAPCTALSVCRLTVYPDYNHVAPGSTSPFRRPPLWYVLRQRARWCSPPPPPCSHSTMPPKLSLEIFEEMYETWLGHRAAPCARCERMGCSCTASTKRTFKCEQCQGHDCSWTLILYPQRRPRLVGGACPRSRTRTSCCPQHAGH
ncbi:hypothetical protein C8Q79DRAFT_130366 [Trametes meyenii]|nr:hypothetical protein C8Q79DRAFT_130366 [Trametes meyenii]